MNELWLKLLNRFLGWEYVMHYLNGHNKLRRVYYAPESAEPYVFVAGSRKFLRGDEGRMVDIYLGKTWAARAALMKEVPLHPMHRRNDFMDGRLMPTEDLPWLYLGGEPSADKPAQATLTQVQAVAAMANRPPSIVSTRGQV